MKTSAYYRLAVRERTVGSWIDGVWESATMVDVVATARGFRWEYCGPLPLESRTDGLDLIARIAGWEFRTGKSFSPENSRHWVKINLLYETAA